MTASPRQSSSKFDSALGSLSFRPERSGVEKSSSDSDFSVRLAACRRPLRLTFASQTCCRSPGFCGMVRMRGIGKSLEQWAVLQIPVGAMGVPEPSKKGYSGTRTPLRKHCRAYPCSPVSPEADISISADVSAVIPFSEEEVRSRNDKIIQLVRK